MVLKNPKSRLGLVNLLSDFILNKIPNNQDSIIQVADCKNFFVIKGKTSYNEPLEIQKIIDEFEVKYSEFIGDRKLTHSIDLLEYGITLEEVENLSFTYHNSKNCSYHYSQIDMFSDEISDYIYSDKCERREEQLIEVSSFPHGYSLSQGRLFYYFGKYITYNIPNHYPITSIVLNITKNEEEFSVYDSFFGIYDDVLKSAILDMFDFDMMWIKNEIKKVDWSLEITNPLEDYEFLKVKLKDFLII
jgi:hypothetical protein